MLGRRQALSALGAAGAAWAGLARGAEAGGPEILLGQTGVLSGPLGVPIKTLLAGANLAFTQANAQGGVNGRRVRLLSLDDELKPDKAAANYKTLLAEHKVLGFFGCVGSGTTAAAAPLLQDSGAPLVGAYAVADSARSKVLGSAYFIRAGSGREAQALVQHLMTLGITRIATAQLDNPGGQEVVTLVEAALAEHKLKLELNVPVKPDGSNAAEAGQALARQAPQAVLMYLAGSLPARVMKAHWTAGGSSSFYGMSIVQGEDVARVLGAELRSLVISQVVPYPWGQVEPVASNFRKLAAAASLPVGYIAFEGYFNALVMLEALKRCGNELTRARLHASLRSMKQRFAGMEVDFSDRKALAGSRFVDMVHVNGNGQFTR
jgi:branched-chain amino acid transport system substrate-binding protein